MTTMPAVRRYACRLTGGDAAAAEDIAQEALLRMLTAFGQRGAPRHPRAWLAKTVRHLAIDLCRREARTVPYAILDEGPSGGDLPGGRGGPPDRSVRWALAKLPPRERAALWAFYFEGRRTAEIARAMRVSDRAVEAVLRRARRRLARLCRVPGAAPVSPRRGALRDCPPRAP